MLARRRSPILLAITPAEALETTRIHSVAGRTGDRTALVTTRPCRAPHHTVSDMGLIGGGQVPMPGDASLAHHGVLLLDEQPECRRQVLEVLRQPLEKNITEILFPARHRPRCCGRPDGAAEPLHPLIILMRNDGDRAGNRRLTPVHAISQSRQGLFSRHFRLDEYVSGPSQADSHRPFPPPPPPSAPERHHGGHEGSRLPLGGHCSQRYAMIATLTKKVRHS
jgi:hypothetical protein